MNFLIAVGLEPAAILIGGTMERAVGGLIRMALTAALATGGGIALKRLVMQAQRDSKGAMQMGMSYGKFNRSLLEGR